MGRKSRIRRKRWAAGFKNFRPLQLVGAELRADGSYIGGHVVLTANEGIADFSLEQYRGNAPDADVGDTAQFRYNDASLDFYEYVRAAMSKGGYAFNPVYEMKVDDGLAVPGRQGGDAGSRCARRSGPRQPPCRSLEGRRPMGPSAICASSITASR